MNDKKAYIEKIVGKTYKFISFDLWDCKEGITLIFTVLFLRGYFTNISKMFEKFANNLVYHVIYVGITHE